MTYESNYLAHHGIKGQKWGIRRFQNEDGTLTEEGRQRYGIDDDGSLTKKNEYRDPASEAAHREKVNKVLKIAAGVTLAAAAGYLAYRTGKKLTGLRDLMRKKAIAEADATVWAKASVDSHKRWMKGDAKLALYDIKRNGRDLANETKLHYNMKSGRDLARKSQWLSARQEHFRNIGNTATRRDALRNWANNNGKIVLDNFGYGQYAKRRGW